MDCIVHGVTKSGTGLSDFHFHFHVVKESMRGQSSKDLRLVSSSGEQRQLRASKNMGSSVSQMKRTEFSQQPYRLGQRILSSIKEGSLADISL